MRRLDGFARLWNDTRSRLPHGAWSWPLVAAAGGIVITLVASPPDVSTASNAAVAPVPAETATACQEQTWPYLSDNCLQRSRSASGQSQQSSPSHVRVLGYEPAMARAAIGATPWAPKDTARQQQSRQKPATQRKATEDRDRTVTVRSGRRDRHERERVYNVPHHAYSAYGYAPRR
jgi:hypothetical protein